MIDTSALLALLQLADSAFPAGGFAHSYGLEQLVSEQQIVTPEDVEQFVRSLLAHSVATGDAAAGAFAARAASSRDLAAVVQADRSLYAMKSASELRDASTGMGRRILHEVGPYVDDPIFAGFLGRVEGGGAPGTHAVVFGAAAAVLGARDHDIAAALMLGSATGILHASMRLMAISHRDVQGCLHRLRPMIAGLATEAIQRNIAEFASFHPAQEIASMRHRRADARLFAS